MKPLPRAKAPFNLPYLLLRQGRYEEGRACFEARGRYSLDAHLAGALGK